MVASETDEQAQCDAVLAFEVVLCVLYASAGLIMSAPRTHWSNPSGPPNAKFSRALRRGTQDPGVYDTSVKLEYCVQAEGARGLNSTEDLKMRAYASALQAANERAACIPEDQISFRSVKASDAERIL